MTRPITSYSSAGKDVITRLLDKREWTRLGSKSGASEVKQHKWFAKINWGLLRNTQPPVSHPVSSPWLHKSGDYMCAPPPPVRGGRAWAWVRRAHATPGLGSLRALFSGCTRRGDPLARPWSFRRASDSLVLVGYAVAVRWAFRRSHVCRIAQTAEGEDPPTGLLSDRDSLSGAT